MGKENKILNFYRQTSCYTDLGLYKELAKKLPDDISQLCLLQRKQMIHPINLKNPDIRNKKNSFFGDMTKISNTRLVNEEDIYPTALAMFAELLRKENKYSINREVTNKIHITCRGQAILLAAILKAKGIPARVRSGFTAYVSNDNNTVGDHWITEYYNEKNQRWVLVDADMCCNDIDFDPFDVPRDKFLFAADAWLGVRRGNYSHADFYNSGYNYEEGEKFCIEILLIELFYDFHTLMNDEIIFLHYPKYFKNKKFELSEEEYQEIDELAELMLNPDDNFDKLWEIWNTEEKFRIIKGCLNG